MIEDRKKEREKRKREEESSEDDEAKAARKEESEDDEQSSDDDEEPPEFNRKWAEENLSIPQVSYLVETVKAVDGETFKIIKQAKIGDKGKKLFSTEEVEWLIKMGVIRV